jgi:oligopeptidase A
MNKKMLSLPDFTQSPEDVCRAAIQYIKYADNKTEEILDKYKKYTWKNLLAHKVETDQEIGKYISLLLFHYELNMTPSVAKLYTDFFDNFMIEREKARLSNTRLLKALRSIDRSKLTREQNICLDQEIEAFEHHNVEISLADRRQYIKTSGDLSKKITQFENNYRQCLQAWSLHITDESRLEGISTETKNQFKQAAAEKGLDGWLITMSESVADEIVEMSENRSLRKKVYFGYNTVASDFSIREENNVDVIKEILSLRDQKARLLKHKSFAEYAMRDKTVNNPDEMITLLSKLDRRVDKKLKTEIKEVKELAKTDGVDAKEWDYTYYLSRLHGKVFEKGIDNMPTVSTFNRILDYFGDLLGLRFVSSVAPSTIHKDVRFYKVYKDNELIGAFYADILRRTNKNDGAWVEQYCPASSKELTTLMYVLNYGKMMTHDELVVMMHEFGHLIHGLSNRGEYYSISGMNSLPWDAVEFPSQFFENFAWHPHVLSEICRNKRGRAPEYDAIRAQIATRRLGSGWFMQKYIKKGLIDLTLHHRFRDEDSFVEKTAAEIFTRNGIKCEPWIDRILCRFHHTFGTEGAYDCAYYVYIWSELFARDAFEPFAKCRTDTKLRELLGEYTKTFLEPTQEDIRVMFQKFMGRNFNTKAWLKFYGL